MLTIKQIDEIPSVREAVRHVAEYALDAYTPGGVSVP